MTRRLLRVLLCLMLVLNGTSVAVAGMHLTLMEADRGTSAQNPDHASQQPCHGNATNAIDLPHGGPPSGEQPGKPDCVKLCLAICVQQNHAMSSAEIDFSGLPSTGDLDVRAFDEPASSILPPPLRPPIA